MKENLQNNQWLDEIRNEMQDFEAPIPANGWERVSSSLPSEKKPMIGPRWMGIAASLLLCAMLGSGYYFFGNEPDVVTAQTEIVGTQSSQEQDTPIISHDEEPAQQLAYQQNTPLLKKEKHTDITAVNLEPIIDRAYHKEEKVIVAHQEETQEQADTIISTFNRDEEKVLLAMNEVRAKTQEDAGWSFGLHLGGHGSLMDSEMTPGSESMSDPTYNGNIGTNIPAEKDEAIDSNHHSSWSFGLSVERHILPKTSVETGLVYTMLTSDVKMKFSGIQSQKIQYLGIPVKINYQIAGTQQCQFYGSGGFMVERVLSANRDDAKIDVNHWQWSSNLSVGGQFRISNHLSFYLEPGVNWYFDADTSAPSLRSESPVYFNLRGGFRFSY